MGYHFGWSITNHHGAAVVGDEIVHGPGGFVAQIYGKYLLRLLTEPYEEFSYDYNILPVTEMMIREMERQSSPEFVISV